MKEINENVKEYNEEQKYLQDFTTLIDDAETNMNPYYTALDEAIKIYKADYVKPKIEAKS